MRVPILAGVPRAVVPAAMAICFCMAAGPLEGQTVTVDCEEGECHVVPYATGTGGFVGRARNPSEGVLAILLCRGAGTTKVVTRELVPGPGGVVSTLFGVDDGRHDAFFCYLDEDATIEIRGLLDGGWYWLTDDSNTAVAPLLSRDVLDNRKVPPVNPNSPDIRIEPNRAGTASFVKQLSTGRVGVLSHVLPEPESRIEPCGPVEEGESEDGSPRHAARETGCVMGDGGTSVGLHTYGVGGRAPLRGGRVVRPETGALRLAVSLWLNGTGSVVYGDPDEFPLTFGWPGIEGAHPLYTEWEAGLLDAGVDPSLEDAGIDATAFEMPPGDDGYLDLLIGPSEAYCPVDGEQHSARVRVRAVRTTDGQGRPLNPVRPRIRHSDDLDGAAAEAAFDVVCPARDPSAAVAGPAEGRDLLVPPGVDGR